MGDRCFILSMNDHIDEEQSRNRKDGRFEVLGSGDAVKRCPRRGRGGAAGRLGARARTRQPARRLARLARPTRPPARPPAHPPIRPHAHPHTRTLARASLTRRTHAPRPSPRPARRAAGRPSGARRALVAPRASVNHKGSARRPRPCACAQAAPRWREHALSRRSAPASTRREATHRGAPRRGSRPTRSSARWAARLSICSCPRGARESRRRASARAAAAAALGGTAARVDSIVREFDVRAHGYLCRGGDVASGSAAALRATGGRLQARSVVALGGLDLRATRLISAHKCALPTPRAPARPRASPSLVLRGGRERKHRKAELARVARHLRTRARRGKVQ